MPKRKRIPDEPPSDELLLAAIERAKRHRLSTRDEGVTIVTIKEHLGIRPTSWTTRQLRPQLQALQSTGLVERFRQHGLIVWSLTSHGQHHLDGARHTTALPESPQHRVWRETQAAASERIEELKANLRRALTSAGSLLTINPEASSEFWYQHARTLDHACRSLGSATYCLNEWPEPDDAHADIDDPPYHQRGRREPRRWAPH